MTRRRRIRGRCRRCVGGPRRGRRGCALALQARPRRGEDRLRSARFRTVGRAQASGAPVTLRGVQVGQVERHPAGDGRLGRGRPQARPERRAARRSPPSIAASAEPLRRVARQHHLASTSRRTTRTCRSALEEARAAGGEALARRHAPRHRPAHRAGQPHRQRHRPTSPSGCRPRSTTAAVQELQPSDQGPLRRSPSACPASPSSRPAHGHGRVARHLARDRPARAATCRSRPWRGSTPPPSDEQLAGRSLQHAARASQTCAQAAGDLRELIGAARQNQVSLVRVLQAGRLAHDAGSQRGRARWACWPPTPRSTARPRRR